MTPVAPAGPDASTTDRGLPILSRIGPDLVTYVPVETADTSYVFAVTASFQLAIEWSGESESWVVRDVPTGVFGQGSTLSEAVRDFQVAAAEHLDVLERQPELSAALAAQRDYLRERVQS